ARSLRDVDGRDRRVEHQVDQAFLAAYVAVQRHWCVRAEPCRDRLHRDRVRPAFVGERDRGRHDLVGTERARSPPCGLLGPDRRRTADGRLTWHTSSIRHILIRLRRIREELLMSEPRLDGIRLGVVRGISYGLFAKPDEFGPAARGLGAGLVRAYVYWAQVEPEPGRYVFDTVD